MKNIMGMIIVLGVIVLSVSADTITTLNGKTYEEVTVLYAEPDGLTVRHVWGVTKIPFTELSDQYRNMYGFDPDQAKVYEEQQAIIQTKIRIEAKERLERYWAEERELLQKDLDAAAKRKKEQQEANDEARRRAWERYDYEMLSYKRRHGYSGGRVTVEGLNTLIGGSSRTKPLPPSAPPFARPPME